MHEAVEYGQRCDEWHNYYSPQSPATVHLTNELARSSLLADRAENFRQAELEVQTVEEARKWFRKQKRRLRYLAGKLSWRPDEAAEQLRGFGEGVAFLIRWFEDSITDVQSQGFLSQEQVDRVFEICGSLPGPASARENPLVYLIHLYNLGSTPAASPLEIAAWLEPANRPEALRDQPLEELNGMNAGRFRALLVGLFQNELDQCRELAQRVEQADQLNFQRALNRVSILSDASARRLARARSDARATFHRALKDLIAMLKRDKEEGPPERPDEEDKDEPEDQDEFAERTDGPQEGVIPQEAVTTAVETAAPVVAVEVAEGPGSDEQPRDMEHGAKGQGSACRP